MQIEISKLDSTSNLVDLNKIAFLHQKYLEVGILSKLGHKFLKLLYENIVNLENSFLVIARDKKTREIIGFCSGAYNTKIFYKNFFRKNVFRLIILFFHGIEENRLKLFLSCVRVFFSEIVSFIFGGEKNKCLAQLLSFVVEESYQSAGVGHLLFMEFSKLMGTKGISEFFTIAAYTQEKAHLFYSRHGGVKTKELKLDELRSSQYYFNIKTMKSIKYGS